ncbi:enoyl-CoA hydratase-related protein [Pontibacter sp. G13]|uniref:enoyl-CoA hydratase-related protein n=1 Tax=Pontibacter sp. G13 TaxID=3074898 RepID=UPI00288B9E8B|nr:enoyl-CoA hydratase-related protein [Pontibacter sp. G13]WNJ16751.1 enoyl-CoA hydratase-related protein [Pontibacter sp. G13]
MYNTLTFELNNHIATITLNRPDTYNAFNEEMSAEFIKALKQCRKDPEVRVIVLTGAGKAFCSGQDLKDAKSAEGRSLGDSVERRYNPMIRLIRETEKPFVCRLNGVAAGAGASLALACDYVIASSKVKMVWAFVNIGLVLDSGSSWFLPRLVGHRKAFELATLGEKITAPQALELGMVNQVVEPEQLDEATATIAGRYAKSAPKSIALMKRMLNRSFESSLDEMLEQEKYSQEIAGKTADYKEGVQAFVEKRPAEFTGK